MDGLHLLNIPKKDHESAAVPAGPRWSLRGAVLSRRRPVQRHIGDPEAGRRRRLRGLRDGLFDARFARVDGQKVAKFQ